MWYDYHMLDVTNEALPENLCNAQVIADSISQQGCRVTTFEATMHRFVLAEFNTHRVFSRSSASSRAIPVPKRMEDFRHRPAFPLTLPAEQAGMQGGAELEGEARDDAIDFLTELHGLNYDKIAGYLDSHSDPTTRLHKSVLARYMEPYLWHKVIVTATDWDGFFGQRVSPLAQPEIHHPAELIRDAYDQSTPDLLRNGDWHLPYVNESERDEFEILDLVKLSTARCARVSYLNHDGTYDPEKDIGLWDRLTTADPPHAAPLEMPCRADFLNIREATWYMLDGTRKSKDLPYIGNLLGFMQARHLVLGF